MMEIDATKIAGGEEDVMTNAAKIIAMYDPRANGGGFGVLLALIIIIVIGWNTIKLLLEVVERYLMVGVLTFTSPLAWSTVSSRSTHQIFSKWFSMFFRSMFADAIKCMVSKNANVYSCKWTIGCIFYDLYWLLHFVE